MELRTLCFERKNLCSCTMCNFIYKKKILLFHEVWYLGHIYILKKQKSRKMNLKIATPNYLNVSGCCSFGHILIIGSLRNVVRIHYGCLNSFQWGKKRYFRNFSQSEVHRVLLHNVYELFTEIFCIQIHAYILNVFLYAHTYIHIVNLYVNAHSSFKTRLLFRSNVKQLECKLKYFL